MIFWLRSIAFDIVFSLINVITCITYLPLLLAPHKFAVSAIEFYLHIIHAAEKYILGLDYEIRGREHLLRQGSYIVAAKHQSMYETFKLFILFKAPAIILKKELIRIPLWGQFLLKGDPIPIDRKDRETAMASIVEGAKRVKAQGRPIIIFPQGTRVKVEIGTDKKPYKLGIYKMYEATDLPVIPMALNSGLFWPKGALLKKPGKITLQFLPPIQPGLSEQDFMTTLEKSLESASIALMNEAKEAYPYLKDIETVT